MLYHVSFSPLRCLQGFVNRVKKSLVSLIIETGSHENLINSFMLELVYLMDWIYPTTYTGSTIQPF